MSPSLLYNYILFYGMLVVGQRSLVESASFLKIFNVP